MANNPTVSNSYLSNNADYKARTTDLGATGHIQHITLVDQTGAAVSAGAGTQYTEGDTDASITGTAMMMEGAANALVPAQGTVADGLLVNLGGNNDITVTSGTVTANAGTNLNTSLLALEAGGNLAGAATSLAVIDDWDETDRAKVNIVAGQAGITAGAGAVGASTPRMTLASDDPAVTSLAIIDDWDESDRAKVNPIAGQVGVQGGSGTVTALTQRVVLATDVALPAGTNAIGKLAANSGVDIGDVDILSIAAGDNNIGNVDIVTQPARTNTTDKITAFHATNSLMDGTTALTPKFAVIDAATSGDNTLVASVSSKKLRVLSLFMVASAAVTVRFESGASGTALTGQMQLAANGGFVLPYNPLGWFETAATTLLNLELSGAISVDGSLVYVEV